LDIFRETIKEFTLKLRSVKNIILEIEKPAVKKKYAFIQQFLSLISQRFKGEEDRNSVIYKLIEDFIRDISNMGFLEVLVYSVVNNPLQNKAELNDIFSIVKDKFVDILINLGTHKSVGWGDSFREYITRKGIADLLREQDEPTLNIFRQRLSQMKGNMPVSLIELIGYLKKEDWIDALLPFVHHEDSLMRRAVILALGDIGGEKSIEVISRLLKKEKDRNMLILAKDQFRRLKAQR
jgi:hypothetical protein